MFLALVVTFVLLFLVCASVFSAREGYWSPVVIFGITAFYYYLSIPLELYVRGEEVFTTTPSLFALDSGQLCRVAAGAVLALAGFAAGHHFSGLGRQLGAPLPRESKQLPRSILALSIGACLALVLLYRKELFAGLSYAEANARRYDDFLFAFLTKLSLNSIGCIAAIRIQRRNGRQGITMAILGMLIAWGFFTSDKDPLLLAGTCYSATWLGARSRSVRYLWLYLAAALFVIAAVPFFSLYRAGAVDFHQATEQFSMIGSQGGEARGPLISLSVATEPNSERQFGGSYAQALVAWVPRAIWPGRPIDASQQFAFDHLPHWKEGDGLGYSLLAEGFTNFGLIGVFLQYLLLGYLIGKLWSTTHRLFAKAGCITYWRALVVIVYFQLIIFMHRGPVAQIVQMHVHLLPLPIGLLLMFDLRRKFRRTVRAPALRSRRRMIARPSSTA